MYSLVYTGHRDTIHGGYYTLTMITFSQFLLSVGGHVFYCCLGWFSGSF